MKALKVTLDLTKKFKENLKALQGEVLVGIPEGDPARKDGDPINNASLLAIANFGSPANNIPAWPIMEIGIKNAKEELAEEFKKAAIGALSKGVAAISQYYNRAGIIASTSIKKVINTQEDVPEGRPLPATLAARKSKGEKYWLVTGQMRNAITYVIKDKR
jgi:hypothetical protein